MDIPSYSSHYKGHRALRYLRSLRKLDLPSIYPTSKSQKLWLEKIRHQINDKFLHVQLYYDIITQHISQCNLF